MRTLQRVVALASASTVRKRVLSRFLWDKDRVTTLTKEVATLRVASYEGRLQQLAAELGIPGEAHLTDSVVLHRLTQDARGVAIGIVHSHNQELRAFVQRQGKGMAQAELARNVAAWEQQRSTWKAAQITLTEGMTGRNEAMADVLAQNRIQTRVRVTPRSAAEPKCAALIARGWIRQADVDFSFPLHPSCKHSTEVAVNLQTVVQDRPSVWLGQRVDPSTGARL